MNLSRLSRLVRVKRLGRVGLKYVGRYLVYQGPLQTRITKNTQANSLLCTKSFDSNNCKFASTTKNAVRMKEKHTKNGTKNSFGHTEISQLTHNFRTQRERERERVSLRRL